MSGNKCRFSLFYPTHLLHRVPEKTEGEQCVTNGFFSRLMWAAFFAGIVYGVSRRQYVANVVADKRSSQIEELEKKIAQQECQIKGVAFDEQKWLANRAKEHH